MNKNNLGRLVSAAAAAAVLTAGAGSFPQAAPASAAHSANLTGQDAFGITSQMTIGWNLGNTLDCEDTGFSITAPPAKFATAWGQPEPTAELVQTVRNGGFNTIRIPTTWYEHLEWDQDSQMYMISDSWMDYVHQVVDYAYDLDMFIILNIHHEDFINVNGFTDASYADASKKLHDIWSQVAEEFKDYDQHLIFEGMNEPREKGTANEWTSGTDASRDYVNRLNAVFVDAVRSNGSAPNSERLLMLPGYCARHEAAAVNAIEIPANAGNVAISVHAYEPYYFAMATDDKSNHNFPGSSGWGESYEDNLNKLFDRLKGVIQNKNVPIIIGEFGASDFDNTDARVAWAKAYLSRAKEAGIPCVLWDNNVVNDGTGESHGYVYRKTNTWYTGSAPVVRAMMEVYGNACVLPDYEPYVEPEFDWSLIPIEDDWVQLFRIEDGKNYKAWGNGIVNGWQDYLNEKYDIIMVYKSDTAVEMVLQGNEWNRIPCTEDIEPFMARFSFADIQAAMDAAGDPITSSTKMYISATSSELTAYGVYAVPVGGGEEPTDAPTEEPTDLPPTEVPTEVPTGIIHQKPIMIGDLDGNGIINVMDLVFLKRMMNGVTQMKEIAGDIDMDGEVTVADVVALQKYVLGYSVQNVGRLLYFD